MSPKTLAAITAVASSLLTSAVLSPMVTFPTSKHAATSSCGGGELNQIKELERYGTVKIVYEVPAWHSEREKGNWEAHFYASYKQDVNLSASFRKPSLCEAVDALYYKVMEHPMKPTED